MIVVSSFDVLEYLTVFAVLQFIMEQHSLYRAITIVKSSVAGYVVQPFMIKVCVILLLQKM